MDFLSTITEYYKVVSSQSYQKAIRRQRRDRKGCIFILCASIDSETNLSAETNPSSTDLLSNLKCVFSRKQEAESHMFLKSVPLLWNNRLTLKVILSLQRDPFRDKFCFHLRLTCINATRHRQCLSSVRGICTHTVT